MNSEYRQWLEQQKYVPDTITTQLYRAERVEKHHGDLDQHYGTDRMAGLINDLNYSTEDKRRGRPNPSKIPFEGDIRSNLASYRDAVKRYRKFLDSRDGGAVVPIGERIESDNSAVVGEEPGQRIGLERDMQAALRLGIEQLETGLTIIDDGAERSVDSGFIDITARDASGATVVIELTAGPAGQRAVAQILSYIGDVSAEEDGARVRGILIASDFDAKSKAAARMVPGLILRKYNVRFFFSEGHAA
jgi:endonuclease